MTETQIVLGPPEVLWLDSPELEHWTGRTARTLLRDFHPAGLQIYERSGRRYLLHSEYLAFLKATSKRKDGLTNGEREESDTPDHIERFCRDARGRIAAVAGRR